MGIRFHAGSWRRTPPAASFGSGGRISRDCGDLAEGSWIRNRSRRGAKPQVSSQCRRNRKTTEELQKFQPQLAERVLDVLEMQARALDALAMELAALKTEPPGMPSAIGA